MSARRFALFAALAFFIMFVAGNVLANSWLRGWRVDLTESRLYSLSPGTVQTLRELSEPVQLTLYYSRDAAAAVPQLQTYAARVREMLQSYAARSRGRVRFVEVDVQAFSEEEDAAAEAGIQAIRPYEGADPIYFGLVGANSIDDTRAIAFFDPTREPFLEYELTRLIYELENPNRTRVGLITALPIDPGAENPGSTNTFAAEMGRLLTVERIAPDFTALPDVDVLAIIHPGALSAAQLYAIDQFILARGRAFIVLDPASLMAEGTGSFDPFNPTQPGPSSSNLEPLLSRWGVSLSQEVVMDGEFALPVRAQHPLTGQAIDAPQPLFFTVPAEELDREDLMTAWLRRGVNFGLAGGLSVSAREGVTARVLARTSANTMRIPAAAALQRPSPFDIAQMWTPAGRRETLAVRLSGNLQTAYPEGPPEGAPAPAEGQQRLTRSTAAAEIVIVSDSDFLADDFYIDPNSGGAAADNASFALNAIDVLGGSDALVSLRSRAPSERRMEMVERMEREAQQAILSRQEELRADLEQTEAQLAELQATGRGSGMFTGELGAELTPEENAAIEQFRTRMLNTRAELRRTERELRGDIDRLQALVVFINVWLMPLLVAGAGLFFFWRRQRRTRGAQR